MNSQTKSNELELLFNNLINDFADCKSAKDLIYCFQTYNILPSHLYEFKNKNYFTNEFYLIRQLLEINVDSSIVKENDEIERRFCLTINSFNYDIIETNETLLKDWIKQGEDFIEKTLIFHFKKANGLHGCLIQDLYLGSKIFLKLNKRAEDENSFDKFFEVVQKEKPVQIWERIE